jgi:hypothetical protein
MPTQEERVAALERAQRENNQQFTILLGVAHDQGVDIKRMLAVLEDHTAILNQHTKSLITIEQALTALIGEVRDIKAIVTKEKE